MTIVTKLDRMVTYHEELSLIKCPCTTNFGSFSFELTEPVLFAFSRWRSTRYSNKLHEFWVTLPGFYENIFSVLPNGIALNEY